MTEHGFWYRDSGGKPRLHSVRIDQTSGMIARLDAWIARKRSEAEDERLGWEICARNARDDGIVGSVADWWREMRPKMDPVP